MKNQAIYQGLFLIFVALFAAERQKTKAIPAASAETVEVQGNEPSRSLMSLYQEMKSHSLFHSQIEGLSLNLKPHEIQITLQEDDLYNEGEVALNENWRPILDQIASTVLPDLKGAYRVEILGFANALSEKEKASVAMTKSPFVFSANRAEWILQYLDSHWTHSISSQVVIAGAGAVPNGKRFEIRIQEL